MTIALTFATTTITDLSQQVTGQPPSASQAAQAPSAPQKPSSPDQPSSPDHKPTG